MAEQFIRDTGAVFIHPYDDPRVIAGQGTIALELLEEVPELSWLMVPVGGGGLASGVSTAAKTLRPSIHMVGVEPAGADDAYRSFTSGKLTGNAHPETVADGLRGALSMRTFGLIREHVDEVVTVSETAIVRAMRTLWQHLKIIIEPSSAVPYAAVLENLVDVRDQRVGIILTGGNVDLDALPW
jgi:threonine dehydratase